MNSRIERTLTQGEQLRLIAVERLREVVDDLRELQARETLNGFQRWILSDLYALALPALDFPARTILLVAIPHPPYALVDFTYRSRTHRCMSLVWSDLERTERELEAWFATEKLRLAPAQNLPMKRLAVRSGLAVYGRNNVSYVEGMGSHFSLAAWFTDAPTPAADAWGDVRMAEPCDRCTVCLRDCPTGAIRADRFLIDNERCLSFLNEGADPFPAWLPPGVHHCVYDCLRCQLRCPMNKGHGAPIGPIAFDEAETGLLLAATPLDQLPAGLSEKSRRLGFDRWMGAGAIARNLRALLGAGD